MLSVFPELEETRKFGVIQFVCLCNSLLTYFSGHESDFMKPYTV